MDENRRLDDELADLTDAVIENRDMNISQEAAELAVIVRGLRDLIEPNAPPPASFEKRMKQRLDIEWEQRQRRAVARTRPNPALRLVALAAAFAVVLVVIIFVTNNNPSNDPQIVGTAVGSPDALIAVVAIAAVVGAAILVWRNRK